MPKPVSRGKENNTKALLKALKTAYPQVECALHHSTAFELLVATILSAQCTDERVNQVTPYLFRAFPGPSQLAKASLSEVEKIIHSTGFFRNKAKNIIRCAAQICEQHDGNVPAQLDQLVLLPGVGRKTANVVLGNWFGIPGLVVDTHVSRNARRLGLTQSKSPEQIEQDLMMIVPKADWVQFSHWLIALGRGPCTARSRPKCEICPVERFCPKIGVS